MITPLLFQSKFLVLGLLAGITAIGLIMAPNRSRFLLALGTVTAAFQVEILIAPLGAGFTFGYVAFLLLLIFSFIEKGTRTGRERHPIPRVVWPWLALLLCSLFAVTKAVDSTVARGTIILFGFDLIIFFAVLRTVRTPQDIRFFAGCLMAAIMVQSLIGLLQYKFPFFKIGVIDHFQSYMWWRSKGTFFHANHFGMFLMLLLPVTIRSVISAIAEKNSPWVWYGFASAGIGFVALLASNNRGSWGGLTFGLLIMLAVDIFRRGTKIRRIITNLLAVALLVGGLLSIKFAPKIYDRVFADDAEGQLEGRELQMEETIPLVLANPLIGVGYGNDRFYASVIFVHNAYMLIAAETGIPGLLCFIWLLIEIFREIWVVSRSGVLFCANYARGALAALLGFCVASWVGPDFWINFGVQSYFWLLVALIFVVSRLRRTTFARQKQQMRKQQTQAVAATAN